MYLYELVKETLVSICWASGASKIIKNHSLDSLSNSCKNSENIWIERYCFHIPKKWSQFSLNSVDALERTKGVIYPPKGSALAHPMGSNWFLLDLIISPG